MKTSHFLIKVGLLSIILALSACADRDQNNIGNLTSSVELTNEHNTNLSQVDELESGLDSLKASATNSTESIQNMLELLRANSQRNNTASANQANPDTNNPVITNPTNRNLDSSGVNDSSTNSRPTIPDPRGYTSTNPNTNQNNMPNTTNIVKGTVSKGWTDLDKPIFAGKTLRQLEETIYAKLINRKIHFAICIKEKRICYSRNGIPDILQRIISPSDDPDIIIELGQSVGIYSTGELTLSASLDNSNIAIDDSNTMLDGSNIPEEIKSYIDSEINKIREYVDSQISNHHGDSNPDLPPINPYESPLSPGESINGNGCNACTDNGREIIKKTAENNENESMIIVGHFCKLYGGEYGKFRSYRSRYSPSNDAYMRRDSRSGELQYRYNGALCAYYEGRESDYTYDENSLTPMIWEIKNGPITPDVESPPPPPPPYIEPKIINSGTGCGNCTTSETYYKTSAGHKLYTIKYCNLVNTQKGQTFSDGEWQNRYEIADISKTYKGAICETIMHMQSDYKQNIQWRIWDK